MKHIVTALLTIFVITQFLSLDFDNLMNWTLNKRPFINTIIAMTCLIGYEIEKKKQTK